MGHQEGVMGASQCPVRGVLFPSIREMVFSVAACGLLCSLRPTLLAAAGPASGDPVVGQAVAAGPAVTETTSEIMARQMRMSGTPQKTLEFFLGRADTSHKKVDPAAASRRQGPATGPQSPEMSSGGGPLLPQTIGVNADGPASGSSPCGTPPDTMGAIGPTQFVVFENCNIVTYSKATGAADGVLNTTPNNFFNSVRSSSTSDPHVRYDRLSQRWFLLIIDVTFPNNRVLLAVSNSATITPSTVWTFFYFQTAVGTHTSCLADYPTPGIDANAVYVGVNQFCGGSLNSASYAGSDFFVVQKSSVLGAGPTPHVTGFTSTTSPTFPYGTIPWTPHGVDNSDPAATEGWLIGTDNYSWSQLDLIRITNPGTASPTSSSVPIATANQGSPITQPHLGNTGGPAGEIDAIDNRPMIATYRDGSLWTSMPVGVTMSGGVCTGVAGGTADRDAVFWWEIRGIPTGSTPSIHQAGIVCDTTSLTNPYFYSYGSITPNGLGQAAAGFTIAGSLTYISGGTAGRLSGGTLGSLQSINLYAPGVGAYNPSWDNGSGYGFRRWGDYSFTSLDPCDDMTLWTIQEYVPVANQYGSRFAELKGPPPATPASASPPSVAAGQSSVSVVITGTSSSGSGFYDTPSSMSAEPCRLRIGAAVTGGVTVNSMTYTDPTHVTLNLNTTATTGGAKNVTVTNPDGQSATGSSILTITGGCTPPPTPVVTAPSAVGAGCPNRTASVVNHAGSTYAWIVTNGAITAGQGTSQITFTAGTAGTPLTISVTETSSGCTSDPGSASITVLPAGSAVLFYTVAPCRMLDTRSSAPLSAGGTLPVALTGAPCGIPSGATSVSVNMAVTQPAGTGHLTIYPADETQPLISNMNFNTGQTRSNNAVLRLSADGTGSVNVYNGSGGTVQVIIDVNGYFQ
ncbi:MAG: hypothetical protein ACM3JH_01045 [Acidithiobacillales bacterium]